MQVIKDEDLFKHINEYDVILVGTNTYCTMSQGLQRDIMLNYPHVHEKNMETRYGDKKKLGTVLRVDGKPVFALLYICEGNFRPDISSDYLKRESLENCLKICKVMFNGQKIACPLLGGSRFDGNAPHDEVMSIIESIFSDVNIDVYDYHQLSKEEKKKLIREAELKVKAVNRDAYYQMVKERKERENKLKELNGHTRT